MIELPQQDPCEFCEGMGGRDESWTVVTESELRLWSTRISLRSANVALSLGGTRERC
jgi:hypothetical protein